MASLFIVQDLLGSADSVSRLKLVAAAGREHLFISSPFDPSLVSHGKQDGQLRSFLQQCKEIHQQQAHRAGAGLARASSYKEGVVSTSSGGREAREAAHITARSYEALHSKQAPQKEYLAHDHPLQIQPKKHSDLYVQGASSFTDLTSRRMEHSNMIRGTARTMSKQSSGSSESLDLYAPFMGSLDRVQSMESGISGEQQWKASNEQSSTLPRSASQGNIPPAIPPSHHPPPRPPLNKAMARSTETLGLSSSRRTPSYLHLSAGNEEWVEQLSALEDRVGILALRFLHERQDMFKQILRACKFMNELVGGHEAFMPPSIQWWSSASIVPPSSHAVSISASDGLSHESG